MVIDRKVRAMLDSGAIDPGDTVLVLSGTDKEASAIGRLGLKVSAAQWVDRAGQYDWIVLGAHLQGQTIHAARMRLILDGARKGIISA